MNLSSQNEYSLSQLFSTEKRKIIIPDFQRDYCWGDKTHGEKKDSDIVHGFIETLLEEFEKNKESDILLGKIDVYENPKNHIYLTDGQQRLTTLYLLIGMLYRKLENQELKEKLKRCLISDFEENHDDKEPYLQYAVRESTVFFLRDLVNEFFIQDDQIVVSGIKNQPWYFNEYNLDPSIISMISALSIIENYLNNEKISDIDAFSKFIINQVKIQYYDVKDKVHGEERFVIINTTGKSLTVSENIKPILLGNLDNLNDYPKQWEERETWFWKNRNKEKEIIADNGVNDFLTWCFQIHDKQDDFKIIKKSKELLKEKENEGFLKDVQKHFESLKKLIDYLKDEKFQKQFQFINDNKEAKTIIDIRNLNKIKQQNVLLPILSFVSKFENNKEGAYQFLRRLRKNYFDQLWEDRKGNYVDWRYVLQIIEKSSSLHECLNYKEKFLEIGSLSLPTSKWFNDEELIKEKLKEDHRSEIEDWEDHPDFMGDLNPLINIVENKEDIVELREFYSIYFRIRPDDFTYTNDVKFGNLYRLLSYLNNGSFDYRSVAGRGYCMLVKTEKRFYLHNNFHIICKKFKTSSDADIFDFMQNSLKDFFQNLVLKNNDLKIKFEDLMSGGTLKIGPRERVWLWAILEFLNTDQKLEFDKSICQFWEYPNLRIIVDETATEKNNYEIGNLLLGTSYYNNKSGWISFAEYPLMKAFAEKRELTTDAEIKEQTKLFRDQLKTCYNTKCPNEATYPATCSSLKS